MATVNCQQCGKGYKAVPELAGKRLRCKACGGVVAVPAVAADPAVPARSVNAAVPARRPAAAAVVAGPVVPDVARVVPAGRRAAPVAVPAADPEEVDFDALSLLEAGGTVDASEPMEFAPVAGGPPTRSTVVSPGRRTSNTAFAGRPGRAAPPARRFGFRFNRLTIGAIIIGGVFLGAYGVKEIILASHASDTPQALTCEQLGTSGYGANANVRLTDFKVFPVCVYEYDKSKPDEWTTAWVPLLSPKVIADLKRKRLKTDADKLAAVVDNIHVFLKTHTVKSEGDMEAVNNRGELNGLVVNSIESMSAKDKELLHGQFPTLNPDSCMILEEGRTASGGLGFAGLGGGLLLCLGGLAFMFKPAS